MSETCQELSRGSIWHRSACGRKAKVEVDGKWFCGIHNPAAVLERRRRAAERAQPAWDARAAKWRLEAAAPDLLAACQAARLYVALRVECVPANERLVEDVGVLQMIDAAIAKAEGQ